VIDYLGDVPWEENEAAKIWYARVKSRPSFRPLLADAVPGVAASTTYANLDF
jgi:glutathione S-transferase